MSFKFDEQFEFFDAYLKEKVKCVASKNNKRMKMLTHSSHGCWETKVTAGDDFMVCVSIDSHSNLRMLKIRLERIYKPHYDYQNFSPLGNGTDLNRQKYAILQTHWH